MPPKNKKLKITIPDDARWCLDNLDNLTFKKFVEKFGCLDRSRAQQRYSNILNKYVSTKTEQHQRVNAEYKTWISSAYYQRFWNERAELAIHLKTTTACTEFIGAITDERLHALHATTSASAEATTSASAKATTRVSTDNKEDTSAELDLNDGTTITNNGAIIDSNDNIDNPWLFHDNNITRLFKNYQSIVRGFIQKRTTLSTWIIHQRNNSNDTYLDLEQKST